MVLLLPVEQIINITAHCLLLLLYIECTNKSESHQVVQILNHPDRDVGTGNSYLHEQHYVFTPIEYSNL